MNQINFILFLIVCSSSFIIQTQSFAQAEPVMYFCERYDNFEGEVNIGDRYKKGSVTIMVRSDIPLNVSRVIIRIDKYNFRNNKFEYNKKSFFDTEPDANYFNFFMDEEKNMEFEEAGFYRVSLLDEDDQTVASAIIEIID